MMHERGKSDSAVRAVKPANKAERSAAELVEQRAGTKGNADQQSTCRAQGPDKCVWAALEAFRAEITERWRRTLSRRSQKGGLTWARMAKLADDWLPKPRILHPWPNQRFAVKHPR